MRWLVENWHALLAKPWDAVALALLAVLSGAWVGTERQRREKAAGVRTMALVALGSCTFTLVGYSFTSNTGDSGRVAAQIVTGIGFLGAGALLRGPGGVQGMTTAATIWVVAAMGMAIGAGHAGAGVGLARLPGACSPWSAAGSTACLAAGARRGSPSCLTLTTAKRRSSWSTCLRSFPSLKGQ